MQKLNVYIAGKVSKDSVFGKHHWREEFCLKLETLSGLRLANLDPLAAPETGLSAQEIFAKDCQMINKADVFIVYLSDDISVGGSQEILIARYLRKPIIGFAPLGGKFNGARREMPGQVIEDYKDPFVFATCDIVCGNLIEVGNALQTIDDVVPSGMRIIDEAVSE
jgi:nucleoside 2-deoxyribosyltransferase